MSRNRLLGLLAAALLGLSATPAAALEASVPAHDAEAGPVIEIVTLAESAAREHGKLAVITAAARAADPIVDEGVDGVGHLLVEVDEDEQSVTLGVGVDALGLDETITLGMPADAGDDDAVESTEGAEAAPASAAGDKAAMDQAKADAAAAVEVPAGPAFGAGTADANRGASGSVSTGTGTGRSVRPSGVAPDADADTAADLLVVDQNPVLRLLGMLMVAGTAGAWSFAKRHGLA